MNSMINGNYDRNEFLDVVKYITIFAVLWGHVVQQTCMLENPNEDYIFRTIYTFHMPLFMGICGYLFAKSVLKSGYMYYVTEKLPSRLKSLIIPMFSFGILKIIILKIIINQKFDFIEYLRACHAVWFLGDLAINTVLVLLIYRLCTGEFRHDWKFLLLGIPFSAIPKVGYGGQGLFMYIFFVIGYCFVTYKNFSYVVKVY